MLPTICLTPLVERVTELFKTLALTEDHLPLRCAMSIEMLMKVYERMWAGPAGEANSGEVETPSTSDSRPCEKTGLSSLFGLYDMQPQL